MGTQKDKMGPKKDKTKPGSEEKTVFFKTYQCIIKPGNLQNIFLSCALGFELYESNSEVKMANPNTERTIWISFTAVTLKWLKLLGEFCNTLNSRLVPQIRPL